MIFDVYIYIYKYSYLYLYLYFFYLSIYLSIYIQLLSSGNIAEMAIEILDVPMNHGGFPYCFWYVDPI